LQKIGQAVCRGSHTWVSGKLIKEDADLFLYIKAMEFLPRSGGVALNASAMLHGATEALVRKVVLLVQGMATTSTQAITLDPTLLETQIRETRQPMGISEGWISL